MTKAIIAFQKDDFVEKHSTLSQLIVSEPRNYLFTVMNDQATVVVKDIPEHKQTLDGIRMLAGELARELSKRQIKNIILCSLESCLFLKWEIKPRLFPLQVDAFRGYGLSLLGRKTLPVGSQVSCYSRRSHQLPFQ